jgi:hypothetical protein
VGVLVHKGVLGDSRGLRPGQYRPVRRDGEVGGGAGLPVGQASCGVVSTPGECAGSNAAPFGALFVGVPVSSCFLAEPFRAISAACSDLCAGWWAPAHSVSSGARVEQESSVI